MVKKRLREIEYGFVKSETDELLKTIGKEELIQVLKEMLLIRNFEVRGESAYQQGYVGGFFHSYIGQEAIQTAAIHVMGVKKHWWIATYRCHALALLLGVSPNEAMAELYGRATGNAKGRGGSMHFFAERLLGGFGIVGSHVPIALGAAFSLKYKNEEGIAICFLGDGAVAQGAIHESLNLASLWSLPCIYVIENNQWGMGTAVSRAICCQPIADHLAKHYEISSYTCDGMDFFNCYAAFQMAYREIKEKKRPVLIEAVTERFRGHSISDPGLYRSKEEVEEIKKRDPLPRFVKVLTKNGLLKDQDFEKYQEEQKKVILAAMQYAEESPWPDNTTLEEDVLAP